MTSHVDSSLGDQRKEEAIFSYVLLSLRSKGDRFYSNKAQQCLSAFYFYHLPAILNNANAKILLSEKSLSLAKILNNCYKCCLILIINK